MDNFFHSLSPFFKKIKKRYKVEVFLLFLAFFIAVVSLILYEKNQYSNDESIEEITSSYQQKESPNSRKILVDIAGAVKNPGVYESSIGARLKDILTLAGGLSDEADKIFFQRNFNLARLVSDQEKIYIPAI